MSSLSGKPLRYDLIRSEYVGDTVWRDKTVLKNVAEARLNVFMKKLSGRYQSGKFVYLAAPIRRQNTSGEALMKVLNP